MDRTLRQAGEAEEAAAAAAAEYIREAKWSEERNAADGVSCKHWGEGARERASGQEGREDGRTEERRSFRSVRS